MIEICVSESFVSVALDMRLREDFDFTGLVRSLLCHSGFALWPAMYIDVFTLPRGFLLLSGPAPGKEAGGLHPAE